jgi:hypothetical protein
MKRITLHIDAMRLEEKLSKIETTKLFLQELHKLIELGCLEVTVGDLKELIAGEGDPVKIRSLVLKGSHTISTELYHLVRVLRDFHAGIC